MKNIIICTKNANSAIKRILEENQEYDVRVKPLEDLRMVESFNPAAVVLEGESNDIKDILMTTKVSTPLIVATERTLDEITVRAEAYDYLITPINEKELKVRVENMLKIKQLKESISQISSTDELTGLYNRKYLHERLEQEISRSKRYGSPISLILFDIDYFKVVNDMYGYDWGDILLKKISEILVKHARKEDIVTRYGDEEFIIALPNTNEDSAYIFAERVRRDIERMAFMPEGEEEPHRVTISGGISCYPYLNKDENAQSIIRYAEHALYNAKRRGKNKIVQFSQMDLE